MANKRDQTIPMPSDIGPDFEDDHDILNFRPDINFVSPDKEIEEPTEKPVEEDFRKQEVEDLIQRYDAVGELVDMAQARIDDRVESLGSLTIQLDPAVDGPTISAMKRIFPDNPFPAQITYEQYKIALKNITANAQEPPSFGPLEIRDAQENPLKTDFGALSLPPGMARPEVSGGTGVIKPITLPEFVAAAILALFKLLVELITGLIKDIVGLP